MNHLGFRELGTPDVNYKGNSSKAQVWVPFHGVGKQAPNLPEKCLRNSSEEGRFESSPYLRGTHHVAGWELLQSEGLGSREAPGASEPGRVQCRALPGAATGHRVSLEQEASIPSTASDECD
jgi:hypothetical protein